MTQRCIRCKRRPWPPDKPVPWGKQRGYAQSKRLPWIVLQWGDDALASHEFCEECLDDLETHESVIAARVERKKGIVLSSGAVSIIAAEVQP